MPSIAKAVRRPRLSARSRFCRPAVSIGIFPEGRRNRSGDVRRRRPASRCLRRWPGCPVVPACIRGTDRALRLGRISVAFGEPISPPAGRKATREDLAKFTGEIMKAIDMLGGEHSVEIRKASVQGFCFGVAITVKKAEEAIASRGRRNDARPRRPQSADGGVSRRPAA